MLQARKINGKIIPYVLFTLVILILFPRSFSADISKDPSMVDNGWIWALKFFVVHKDNYQWGKDIIYTYGPLGILSTRFFPVSYWLWQLSLDLYIAGCFFFIFNRLLKRYEKKAAYLFLAAYLVSFWEVNLLMQMISVFFLIFISSEKSQYRLAYLISFNSALLIYMKLNTLFETAFILGGLFYILVMYRNYISIFLNIVLFGVLNIALCRFFNVDFSAYFKTSIDTIVYYTYSMHYFNNAYSYMLLAAVAFSLAFAVVVCLFVLQRVRAKKALIEIIPVIPICGMYYILFKQGFTRFDRGHASQYFFLLPLLLFCVYIILPAGKLRRSTAMLQIIAVSATIALGVITSLKHYDSSAPLFAHQLPLKDYISQLASFIGNNDRKNEEKPLNGASYDYYSINQYINNIGNDNPNWHNRPAFQSIVSVSPRIDTLNAIYYAGSKAPDTIIYSSETVDDRNTLWDDPICKKAMFEFYHFEREGLNQQLVLGRRSKPLKMEKQLILDTVITFDQEIKLPELEKGVLMINADISYSFAGKILSTVYQPPATSVKLHMTDKTADTTWTVRFIPPLHNHEDLIINYFIPPSKNSPFIPMVNNFNEVVPNVKSFSFINNFSGGLKNKISVKMYFVTLQG